MPARAKVEVTDRFDFYAEATTRAIDEALRETAREAANIGRAAPSTSGYRIQGIQGTIEVSPVHRTQKGRGVIVQVKDFRGRFFAFGTLGRRRKRLKRPDSRSRTSEKGTGVKKQPFMALTLRHARSRLVENVRDRVMEIR